MFKIIIKNGDKIWVGDLITELEWTIDFLYDGTPESFKKTFKEIEATGKALELIRGWKYFRGIPIKRL